jgi:hypothetical protein
MYYLLPFHCNNGYTKSTSMLPYTYIACLVSVCAKDFDWQPLIRARIFWYAVGPVAWGGRKVHSLRLYTLYVHSYVISRWQIQGRLQINTRQEYQKCIQNVVQMCELVCYLGHLGVGRRIKLKCLLVEPTVKCGLKAKERTGRCQLWNRNFISTKIKCYFQLGKYRMLKHS